MSFFKNPLFKYLFCWVMRKQCEILCMYVYFFQHWRTVPDQFLSNLNKYSNYRQIISKSVYIFLKKFVQNNIFTKNLLKIWSGTELKSEMHNLRWNFAKSIFTVYHLVRKNLNLLIISGFSYERMGRVICW